jgi:hypothetical protein
MGDSEMNEIKAKLKELAALCIDKGLTFHCNAEKDTFLYWVSYTTEDREFKNIGNSYEFATECNTDSLERLDDVIALVENYNG